MEARFLIFSGMTSMQFEEDIKSDDETFLLKFDAWEGPIEALLELARNQKVDLLKIDLLVLIDQYEATLRKATRLRLELAADWLVMAAWLTYLKSRLLLKKPKDQRKDVLSDDVLAFHLKRLALVKDAYEAHEERLTLGRDWFSPSRRLQVSANSALLSTSLKDFLKSYPQPENEEEANGIPMPTFDIASIEGALARFERDLPEIWTELLSLVPDANGLKLRSYIATSLVAALEMTKDGRADITTHDRVILVKRLGNRDEQGTI